MITHFLLVLNVSTYISTSHYNSLYSIVTTLCTAHYNALEVRHLMVSELFQSYYITKEDMSRKPRHILLIMFALVIY